MKKTTRKMLNMPAWAYCVQMATTFLLSSIDALAAPSSFMLPLDELYGAIGAGDHRLACWRR